MFFFRITGFFLEKKDTYEYVPIDRKKKTLRTIIIRNFQQYPRSDSIKYLC